MTIALLLRNTLQAARYQETCARHPLAESISASHERRRRGMSLRRLAWASSWARGAICVIVALTALV